VSIFIVTLVTSNLRTHDLSCHLWPTSSPNTMIPDRTIGRLALYKRILSEASLKGTISVHSHDLATQAGVTAAQVRRDLMNLGYAGSTKRGYEVEGLLTSIQEFLDKPGGQNVLLIGVGNLGRALLSHFSSRRELRICASLDLSPEKTGRMIHGCPCHSPDDLPSLIEEHHIEAAILAIPSDHAQAMADR
jgi:redox-sensing transcriptional repressor